MKPTKRELLLDAERIIRAMLADDNLYYWDDARDWVKSLEQMRESPTRGRKVVNRD